MITTAANKGSTIFVYSSEPFEFDLGSLLKPIDDDEFLKLSRNNQDVQIEMTKDGDLIIMPGTGGLTGRKNAKLIARLVIWAEQDGTGVTFDSDTIFCLPNRAKKIPDASWVSNEKWNALSKEEQDKIVANRQKGKGMSWSKKGSRNLAIVTAYFNQSIQGINYLKPVHNSI